ncbi:MAG TPA: hypothetical protein VMZ91_11210 [Candidatus Paceibacterota bacterium]|nr:hypothetical protein [Candidatus Paceibacterota bacterium]
MPTFEKHCEECLIKLGSEFKEVHLWLDEFFKDQGPKHRNIRHHENGVEEVREKWGEKAAEAAILHIKADCKGIIPTMEQIKLWSLFS